VEKWSTQQFSAVVLHYTDITEIHIVDK